MHAHRVATADKPAPAPPAATTPAAPAGAAHAGGGAASASAPATRSAPKEDYDGADDGEYSGARDEAPKKTGRLGLGTEFGEQRYSAVTFTAFVRAANRPIAVAELRYNDGAGLTALGINVQPLPDQAELDTRESANPFPGDGHFSRAPR